MTTTAAPASSSDPRRIIFLAACLAIFMASVEATIVATAIPTIVGDLGGLRLFSWVFGIYFLTQAVTIPIYGRLADLYGRKTLLTVAIVLFLAGSIMSGFAHNMVELIIYRGLQGLGAGGVQPLATTIVGDLYSGHERAKVQGTLSSVWGISAVAGPLLGAFIVQHYGWPLIFWINVPFGLACIAIIQVRFDEQVQRKRHQIDYLGSLLLALGIGGLMFVLITGDRLDRTLMWILSLVVALLIAALVVHELRSAEPMIPLRLMSIRLIAIANIGNFVTGALAMGITAFLPTFIQGAMGGSAIIAGASLGTLSFSWTLSAMAGSRIMHRTPYRALALLGGVLLVAGGLLLVMLRPESTIALAISGAALIGFGFGFTNLVYIISVQSAVGWAQRGAATASNLFSRQVGQAIGTAAFAAVFNYGLTLRVPNAGTIVTRMMTPAQRVELPAPDVMRYAEAIATSLHPIYIILTALAAAVLLTAFGIPAKMRAGDEVAPA